MSLTDKQKEEILSLGAKMEMQPDFLKDYMKKNYSHSFNEMRLDLINRRSKELGMSYGKFVAKYNV